MMAAISNDKLSTASIAMTILYLTGRV